MRAVRALPHMLSVTSAAGRSTGFKQLTRDQGRRCFAARVPLVAPPLGVVHIVRMGIGLYAFGVQDG